jgi:cyclase
MEFKKNVRIIPRLDIKGPNLVKGINLEGLRVLGKPEVFAKFYYQNGADELFFQDVVASLYDRNNLHDIISKTAKEIFIPLTVGGGIRSIEDIKCVLRAGADKVSINTAAIKRPLFIKEAAEKYGSSTIVVAIEAILEKEGVYRAYTDNGREITGMNVLEWAQQVEALGAGELVITSVDREGTGMGFDIELTKMIADAVSIPVIAHGGCTDAEDVVRVINSTDIDAVCISSILHYELVKTFELKNVYKEEGNISFLQSKKTFGNVTPCSLKDLKSKLINSKIPVRN